MGEWSRAARRRTIMRTSRLPPCPSFLSSSTQPPHRTLPIPPRLLASSRSHPTPLHIHTGLSPQDTIRHTPSPLPHSSSSPKMPRQRATCRPPPLLLLLLLQLHPATAFPLLGSHPYDNLAAQASVQAPASPYTAVLVVPTGVGASIGGYAGDALPVAKGLGTWVGGWVVCRSQMNVLVHSFGCVV